MHHHLWIGGFAPLDRSRAVPARSAIYGDAATVERCQAKDLMRKAYRLGGAPTPAFAVARTFDEVEAFVAEHGLPVVLKPSLGWGQRAFRKSRGRESSPRRTSRARIVGGGGCWSRSSSMETSSA